MSDIRGYSSIAERADPSALAGQLNVHRAEMNRAILDASGTVMQFVGDAVMAVFGAPVPVPDHAGRAVEAALACTPPRHEVNRRWVDDGPGPLRARHRGHHRPRRGGAARVRGAPRVHARGRHGEPGPAPPAVGRAGRDRAQRGHLPGPRRPAAGHRAPPGAGEGPRGAGRGLEGGGGGPEATRVAVHDNRDRE